MKTEITTAGGVSPLPYYLIFVFIHHNHRLSYAINGSWILLFSWQEKKLIFVG
ncbi:MAG: hypothetical protein IM581_16630 [Chitinophagaceae bacterium]|jgi:hypothetical protein|nr:hypothetical protein [Chitinophagaceae bacterium]